MRFFYVVLEILNSACEPIKTTHSPFLASSNIYVGSKVNIIGSRYAAGQSIPLCVKKKTYTKKEVKEDRTLLKEIISWMLLKDLSLIDGGYHSSSIPKPNCYRIKITASVLNFRTGVGTSYKANTFV